MMHALGCIFQLSLFLISEFRGYIVVEIGDSPAFFLDQFIQLESDYPAAWEGWMASNTDGLYIPTLRPY
jgi:hypothetical protein